MLVEIEQHPMQNEAGCAMLVIGDDLAPAEILRHQLARREVVLEIDDHRTVSPLPWFLPWSWSLRPSSALHATAPRSSRARVTATSSGVRGMSPIAALSLPPSMRCGSFQRYAISDNSRQSGTIGRNAWMSHQVMRST